MDYEIPKISVPVLCNCIKKCKITDVNTLNRITDKLIAAHSYDVLPDDKAFEDLICSLTRKVHSKNDHLLSKFCTLLCCLLQKHKVVIQQICAEITFEFLTSSIRTCGEWVQNDILLALTALLEDNSDKIEKPYEDLVEKNGFLIDLLTEKGPDKSVQYHAFQCLLNLVKNLGRKSLREEYLELIYQKCLLVLKEKFICNSTDVLTLKVMIHSLKSLQHIFDSKNSFVNNYGELLGSLKSILFYGLPGQSFMTDTNLQPTLRYPGNPLHLESQSESDSPFPKLRKQKRNKRRQKKAQKKPYQDLPPGAEECDHQVDSLNNDMAQASISPPKKNFQEIRIKSSSSDSELSDVESHMSKIKALQSSVRQNAYLALQAIIKTSDKKIIFGYWSSFLPEHPNMPGIVSSQNIFTTILKDPVPKVRLNALGFLAEILRGSKQFLSHADGRNVRHMSFTSLSSILATMISELHRCLLLALLSENSNVLLTQILKCYVVLAENVPYSKLNKDILKFLKNVKALLHHRDIQVQVASLAVFGAIVSSDQTPPEVEELMLSADFECACSALNSNTVLDNRLSQRPLNDQYPWIIGLCKQNIFEDNDLTVKIQSLQLLSNTVGKYFHNSKPFFHDINEIVLFCLNNNDTTMQLHGTKLLDILGRCMNGSTTTENKIDLKPVMSELWGNVLTSPLIKCLTNDDMKTLQSMCCDCLSTLPADDFESLPPKQQILYITILLGLAKDSNTTVRGAAIRCLGLFCMFPSLTQDPSFLNDVSDILIKSIEDTNVNVRFKASWSLGNLSDALFLNRDQVQLGSEISPQFFHSTGMACIKFSKDNDRVKANAVRALGNFLNYIPKEFVDLPMMQNFIRESCQVLKTALSATFMKVCWNSCYAVRNMLKNTYLIEHSNINLEEILNCLLNVLKSPNFKVRISSSQALTSMQSRELYGNIFPIIWRNLVSALFSISVDVNFKEVKHQENLCDQLCFSLCQLIVLITLEDISAIANSILDSREILLTSMWKFGSRMEEDKNMIVAIAVEKLIMLKTENTSNEIEPILISLLDIINQSTISFYDFAENAAPK